MAAIGSKSKRPNWVLHFFRLFGLEPLFMDPHRTEDIWENLVVGSRKGKKDTTTPLHDRCAKKVIVHPVSGITVIPKDWLWASFRQGGKKVKFDAKANFTNAMNATLLPAFIRLQGEHFRLVAGDWKPDLRQGALKSAGGKGTPCPIMRPQFPAGWVCDGFAMIDVNYTDFERIQDILVEAGRTGGIGSYRPNCGGFYGTYEPQELRPATQDEYDEYVRVLNTAPLQEATAS